MLRLLIAACVLPQTAALVGIRPSPASRRSAAASDAADAATSIAAAATAANKNDDDAKIKAIAGPALLGTLADPLLSACYGRYVEQMRAAGALDFLDLIRVAFELLESHADVRASLRARGLDGSIHRLGHHFHALLGVLDVFALLIGQLRTG